MVRATQLLIAVFVVGVTATSLFAEASRRLSAPLPPGHKVFALYEAGKLEEARKALVEFVKVHTASGDRIVIEDAIDAETRLGVNVAVDVVLQCFTFEQKYGSPSKELLEASRDAMAAVDKAVKEVTGKFTDSERVTKVLEYCQSRKAKLLAAEIVALRNDGQSEQAKTLVEQNAAFLTAQGVPVESLLPTVTTVPVPSATTNGFPQAKEESVGPGAVLPLCQLILAYYQALAAEDAGALDKCLVAGPEFLDGKGIVKRLSAERASERDFDAIGPAFFDSQTVLQVLPAAEGELRVVCSKVVKSFRLRGKSFSQRESDQFKVRIVDGAYKIVKTKGGK